MNEIQYLTGLACTNEAYARQTMRRHALQWRAWCHPDANVGHAIAALQELDQAIFWRNRADKWRRICKQLSRNSRLYDPL